MPSPAPPTFASDQILPVFADPARYHILARMLDGAVHSAAQLADTRGASRMSVSKHLLHLRTAGLVEPCASLRDRRSRSYRLRPALVHAVGGPRVIDLGCCLLRFEEPAPAPAPPTPSAPPAPATRSAPPAPAASVIGDFG